MKKRGGIGYDSISFQAVNCMYITIIYDIDLWYDPYVSMYFILFFKMGSYPKISQVVLYAICFTFRVSYTHKFPTSKIESEFMLHIPSLTLPPSQINCTETSTANSLFSLSSSRVYFLQLNSDQYNSVENTDTTVMASIFQADFRTDNKVSIISKRF